MAEKPKSVIEGVGNYFMACPLLKDGTFHVDALGDEAGEYTIGVGSFDPVIERYLDGSSDRRYRVTFGSREEYDLDRVQNIANSTFYEDLAEWIEDQDAAGNLPELPEKCHPETIRAVSSGFLFSENGETARYEIQVEVTYHKEA